MCDPVTMTVVAVGLGAAQGGLGIVDAFSKQASRKAQKSYAQKNARMQRAQVNAALQDETEANAQKSFQLAQKALAARGVAQATNLGDRSVRAIGRSIGFELGQDQATIEKNQEIARRQAAARLTGIDLTLVSQKEQIGDTSLLGLGLDIAGATLGGAQSAMGMMGMMGGMPGGAAAGGAEGAAIQLPASTTMDYSIA